MLLCICLTEKKMNSEPLMLIYLVLLKEKKIKNEDYLHSVLFHNPTFHLMNHKI